MGRGGINRRAARFMAASSRVECYCTEAMKLATLKTVGRDRDGVLIVVSHDLKTAVVASAIAPTLQSLLEDWPHRAPKLAHLSATLNAGKASDAFRFDPARC